MIIGLMGKMGAGKTLTQSILTRYYAQKTNSPYWSNYSLDGSKRIKSLKDIWKIENGIIAWDEIWLTIDARMYKDNVGITRWINQLRKKSLMLLYTTQHIRQVELRLRNATDVLICCDKMKNKDIKLTFIDWQYRRMGRRMIMKNPKKYYSLYNTYEVLEPVKN